MSTRLVTGGRFLDRSEYAEFTFNGKPYRGFKGDTIASALLANNQVLIGRSFKYHRPRGIVASGADEPNALLNLGEGAEFEPNQRATTTELRDGMICKSQNHWPSLEFDLGALNNILFSRFLPAGFYYKMFIHPRPFWKHVYEPLIRQSAGLGKAPKDRDMDDYEHFYAYYDIVVVGGGVAGLVAARVAGEAGARVLVIEQTAHWGGRVLVDGGTISGQPACKFVEDIVSELESMGNVAMRKRLMGAGIYDHGYVLCHEQSDGHGPRHRLWKIRARRVITATGAIERPLSFAGNDLPGVMLASAIRDYAVNYAVSTGDRTVVVTNNDDAYLTAIQLKELGLEVPAIIDARLDAGGELAQKAKDLGIDVQSGMAIAEIKGRGQVAGVRICSQAGEGTVLGEIDCEAVAMSGGWSPVVHLWSHSGGKLYWDDKSAMFRPDTKQPPTGHDGNPFVIPAGSASGFLSLNDVLNDACAAGKSAATDVGRAVMDNAAPHSRACKTAPIEPVWLMPQGADIGKRMKSWLDFQNDVKVSDVQLAAREGFESVEHAKRYTTLGMATDQGKLSNINGLAILSDSLNQSIGQTGTTTFRPPYAPVSFASIAGEARGPLFQPVRKTPMHKWHEDNGASWEPVGYWRRPYAYPRAGESLRDAVNREIVQTRNSVGILDASTLGKLLVKGPEAGRFLDMIYTNTMSTLKPGRCRYGLMCSENGFLIDDGVVARIDENAFLCHTTTGGADSIHAHMEEWLQCEWWSWKVYVANLTEQFAQIAVVGPNSRKVLERLGSDGFCREELPFMSWKGALLDGIKTRVYRISFSGELSYEIAVPAKKAQMLWDDLIEAGGEFGIAPYGTEALHVMRAEKGFIMIGDETDGTVIPQDLNLHWAISKKKEDYLGKRAQMRKHMISPDRWRLVGLETVDGSVLPEGAYAIADGKNCNGQRNTQGRVTSTYYSPTLGRGIAMGLVHGGLDRIGEIIDFQKVDGTVVPAKIANPLFYDSEGERQNV
ncbi:MAG: sarcosine oxidase subunit alpha family protein [Roseovarius sp.]|nr:sarcosine oxidase subunit alpha family protein [Roseovarius sp.]